MINEMADLILLASIPGEDPYPVNGAYYLAILGLNPNVLCCSLVCPFFYDLFKDFFLDVYLLLGYGLVFFVLAFLVLAFAQKEKR